MAPEVWAAIGTAAAYALAWGTIGGVRWYDYCQGKRRVKRREAELEELRRRQEEDLMVSKVEAALLREPE